MELFAIHGSLQRQSTSHRGKFGVKIWYQILFIMNWQVVTINLNMNFQFIQTFWIFWRQILNKFCPWSFSNWFVAVPLGISSFILTLRNTEQRWLNTCWNVTERQDFVCWLLLIVPGYRSCVKVYSVIVVTLNISHFTKRTSHRDQSCLIAAQAITNTISECQNRAQSISCRHN